MERALSHPATKHCVTEKKKKQFTNCSHVPNCFITPPGRQECPNKGWDLRQLLFPWEMKTIHWELQRRRF